MRFLFDLKSRRSALVIRVPAHAPAGLKKCPWGHGSPSTEYRPPAKPTMQGTAKGGQVLVWLDVGERGVVLERRAGR